jgi:hypothetical protein
VSYQSSEEEEEARKKLYEYNRDLYGAALDLLSIVRASTDTSPASRDVPCREPARLRYRAEQIEREDAIIHRAREIVKANAKRYVGKLPSEEMER